MREYPNLPQAVGKPSVIDDNSPASSLGSRLRAIRARYLAPGGQLLTKEEVSDEISERRGGGAGLTSEKEDLR